MTGGAQDKVGLTEQWFGATPSGEDAFPQAYRPEGTERDPDTASFARAMEQVGDTDGLYVWVQTGPPVRAVVDEMDWFEGDHKAVKRAVEAVTGDPEAVVWQNEGSKPEGEGWSQLWPPTAKDTPKEPAKKGIPAGSMVVPDQSNVIAIDLNGTLATGRGPDPAAWGQPTYGAAEAMEHLHGMGYRLFVNSVVGDVGAIDGWLQQHGLRDYFEGINVSPAQPPGANPGKQNAAAYVDDRAVPFRGNWRETVGDLFLCDALTKSLGKRLRVKPARKSADCGPGCPCAPCQEEGHDKGRGQPCKQGEAASRTGCIPRGKPAGGKKPRGPAPKAEDMAAKVRSILGAKGYDREGLQELKNHLLSMKVADIHELKRHLGLKAQQGPKAGLAKRVAERALEKLKEAADAAAAESRPEPAGAGSDGAGGGGPAGETPGAGGRVAGEAEGPADAGDGAGRADDGNAAGGEAPARVPASKEVVTKRAQRYADFFRAKGQHQAAEWMDLLKQHVEQVGTDEALRSLGPETAGAGEDVQYGGFADMGDFAEKYLARNGITLIHGGVPEGDTRAVSTVTPSSDAEGLHSRGDARDFFPKLQGLRDKLHEAQHLPGLEKSEDLSKLTGGEFGADVPNFTPDVVKKLDETYGEGKWIVKSYSDDAYAGFGIFFPQRVKQLQQDAQNTMWTSGGELAKYGFSHLRDDKGDVVGIKHKDGDEYRFGTEKYQNTIQGDARHWADQAASAALSEKGTALPKGREGNPVRYMAQPAFPVVGVSDAERAAGVTFKKGQEGRVHIVTRNGKAEVIPHSTWLKEEHLPVVFEDDDTRAMAQAAVDAINALPESERAGQLYAPDIVKTADGYRVVEANPANEAGASGYLQDNPFIIDSYVSHLTGREPAHVSFLRKLLSDKKGAA